MSLYLEDPFILSAIDVDYEKEGVAWLLGD
jgi:hypothetical protein